MNRRPVRATAFAFSTLFVLSVAAVSGSAQTVTSNGAKADIDDSGTVDFSDLLNLGGDWRVQVPVQENDGDIDDNGVTDSNDLLQMLAFFGTVFDVVITEEAVIIDGTNSNLSVVSIGPGELTLMFEGNTPPDINPGDVLLIAVGEGAIVEVVSVQIVGNTMTLETIPASLNQVVEEGQFQSSFTFGDTLKGTIQVPAVSIDLAGTVLTGITGRVEIQSGSITYSPVIELEFNFEDGVCTFFRAVVCGPFRMNMDFQIQVTGGHTPSFSGHTFDSASRPFQGSLGEVPIVGVHRFYGHASMTNTPSGGIETVSASVRTSPEVCVGSEFKDGNWTRIVTDIETSEEILHNISSETILVAGGTRIGFNALSLLEIDLFDSTFVNVHGELGVLYQNNAEGRNFRVNTSVATAMNIGILDPSSGQFSTEEIVISETVYDETCFNETCFNETKFSLY